MKQATTERWLNPYQLSALLAWPRILAVEAGRRGGKTEEILSERFLTAMLRMPRGSGFFAGKSYSKLLDHMIPALIAGFNKRNFIEGEDYVIGRTPPKHFNLPLIAPKKWDHYGITRWGSGFHLISFDHNVTSNSLTTCFGAIDEAKQMDPVRVKSELLKTMSGHARMPVRHNSNVTWGDMPFHRSLTILTDKFIGKNDYRWVDEYKKQSITQEEYWQLVYFAEQAQKRKLPELTFTLWQKQRESTMYLQYSSRESLPVIGIDYFKDEFKNSNPIEFRTSILNEDVTEIEGGFYKFLSEPLHTYEARNNNRIDTLGVSDYLKGIGKNCWLDNDWKSELPLKVAIDYGTRHSWFLVAQQYSNTHFFLSNFWTDNEQLSEGVDKVCKYYAPHNHKVIDLYDDPSGHKKGTDQKADLDKIIDRFNYHGWRVNHKTDTNNYIPHYVKYRVWEKGLDERADVRDDRYTRARFNKNNCYETFYSCSKAPTKITATADEYQKDKSSEKDHTLPQWKATHLSDCADMIYCTDNVHLYNYDEWSF